MAKAIISLTNSTDTQAAEAAEKAGVSLKGNTSFPSLAADATELQTLATDLFGSIAKAKGGSTLDTSEKNAKRKMVNEKYYYVGLQVQEISKGDNVKIISAGYRVEETASAAGVLPAPTNVKISVGPNKGMVMASWSVVKHAYSYLVEYTNAPVTSTSVWVVVAVTKSKVVIEGLTSGGEYTFRVTAVGSNLTRLKSEEITTFVI